MDLSQSEIPQDIRTFLEGLLDDAGMTPTPEIKEEMIKDLYVRLEHMLIAAAAERLQPEDLEAFQKLLESKASQTQLQQFLSTKLSSQSGANPDSIGADAQEIFAQAIARFRDMYLASIIPSMEKADSIKPN